MLDDGAEIVADISGYETRTEWAKNNADGMFKITDSIPNNPETCYFLKMNKPEIALINKKAGKKFTVQTIKIKPVLMVKKCFIDSIFHIFKLLLEFNFFSFLSNKISHFRKNSCIHRHLTGKITPVELPVPFMVKFFPAQDFLIKKISGIS